MNIDAEATVAFLSRTARPGIRTMVVALIAMALGLVDYLLFEIIDLIF